MRKEKKLEDDFFLKKVHIICTNQYVNWKGNLKRTL